MSAPQVTPAMVEAAIASEHYFTGSDGAYQAGRGRDYNEVEWSAINGSLSGVQFCVLVLKNGHLVTGEALLQDLSKPDPERARASARRRAFDKAYDMLVYAERERLAAAKYQSMPAVGAAWTVIDPSNHATLPPAGDWLVTVDDDGKRELMEARHHGGGIWHSHSGFLYDPIIAWAPRPEAYSGPVPSEG